MVYTSATLSLAALEYFVHLEPPEAPDDLVAVPAEIPGGVNRMRVAVSELPRNWRHYPAPEAMADLGTRWAETGATAVLIVPSAIIPAESNYLINPRHADFFKIRVGRPDPFSFDPRMWKR